MPAVSTLLLQAAALLTTTPPDVWGVVGRGLTVALGLSGGALLFTWRAIGRAWFCAMLTACRPDLKATIDTLYAERIEYVDEGVERAAVHDDKLLALEAAIMAQGESLSDRFAESAEQQTATLREMTKALQQIQRDGNATASAVHRIEGFIDGARARESGWPGGERRVDPR